jgi:hypothetical protein
MAAQGSGLDVIEKKPQDELEGVQVHLGAAIWPTAQ